MDYTTGEELLLARVQSSPTFSADNASAHNWKVLTSGKSDHYAILAIDTFSVQEITISSYLILWRTNIEIWQRYKNENESVSDLANNVTELMNYLAQYRNLNDATRVLGAKIVSSQNPEEMWDKNGALTYLRIKIAVEWAYETTVTYLD